MTDYLLKKVERVNVNNPKANSGGVLLKLSDDWEEAMSSYVHETFTKLQQNFAKDSSDSPAGTAKLTNVSIIVGKVVSQRIHREPLPWSIMVRLGDLFIEGFVACDLVSLYYPKIRNSSYVVSANSRWTELADIPLALSRIKLTGTSDDRPAPISSNEQDIKGATTSLIKGVGHDVDLSAQWVAAVNKLQSVGWRINRRVLDTLTENREHFVSDKEITDNDAKEQKRRSKKVEWSFITKKAELLKDKDVFYQYLDADYRGRLYYIEPFLNFQGSDIARSLLKFARAKPMTEDGLYWLAIHTASSFNMSYGIDEIPEWCEADYYKHLKKEGLEDISVDKMTLADRVEWTNQYMKEIVNAGKDKELSRDAEKAVAFLACCIEWADINEAALDNRIHMSHLPIPVDGSNNGWQHLGAISKDKLTGKLVGLVPVDIQKDFYVQTAKRLMEDNKDEHIYSILNKMPMKHIRKGISKRGSMTRAYSAGQTKISENMFFDCKTEDFHTKYGIEEKDCYKLAGQLIKAINEVCPGPLKTMAYLQAVAKYELGSYIRVHKDGSVAGAEFATLEKRRKELFKARELSEEELEELDAIMKEKANYNFVLEGGNGKEELSWSTPSGFKVKYQNWIMKANKCHGSIGKERVYHVAQLPTTIPDIRGFMCGISPNFIHSMDASHMALVTANWTGEFGAVHDSFSTHACDVDKLLKLTKDKFIEMYDVDNIYEDIEQTILTTPATYEIDKPEYGELDIQGIRESEYFFA